MEKELQNIFKPIFEDNTKLQRILTNSHETLTFEELCNRGVIVDELNENVIDSANDEKPCVIIISISENPQSNPDINLDIVCLHKYLLMDDRRLRPHEIVSELNKVINHKAKLGEGTIEMAGFNCQVITEAVSLYSTMYSVNENLLFDGETNIIEFYDKNFIDIIDTIFGNDEIRQLLRINGVNGGGLSTEELCKKDYVRFGAKFSDDSEKENVFVIIQLEEMLEPQLDIDIVGCEGNGGLSIAEIKGNVDQLSNAINNILVTIPGVQQVNVDDIELGEKCTMTSRVYSISKTEETIKVEDKKKFKLAFFADIDVLSKLPVEGNLSSDKELCFCLDLIQEPFHLTVSIKEFANFEFYVRDELGAYDNDNPDAEVKISKGVSEPEIKFNKPVVLGFEKMYGKCIEYMTYLANYLGANNLVEQYGNMNIDKEGILLYLEGDEIKTKVVKGKERPNLMCTTLFNGNCMMRPYADEVSQAWRMELVPFNSKVEAAENGDVDMMMEVAVAYFNGEDGLADVEKNPEKASYWMLKAAKNGKPEAMFNIGLFYAHGFGVSRSFENAAEWMEKAVDAGETDALEVARQYRKGAESLTRAEAGNPQAQADYAIALMTAGNALNQINSSSIYEESVEWAQKANGNDNGESYLVLGLAYEKGRGVEQDTNKAVEFYAKGEEKGQEICMNNLGRLYMIGDAVPKDEEKAFELFLKSAEKGYGVAMQNVAQCYERENGTEYNIDKAIEWYEKSLKVLPNNELEQKVAFYKRLKSDGSLSFESG